MTVPREDACPCGEMDIARIYQIGISRDYFPGLQGIRGTVTELVLYPKDGVLLVAPHYILRCLAPNISDRLAYYTAL